MSVRKVEDSPPNNNCRNRGLGVAAAAIGVGVGAALYYFFSNRSEQPDGQGTTSGWRCEEPQSLNESQDSYTTISENTTTDTSMNENSCCCYDDSSSSTESGTSASESDESFTELSVTDTSLEEALNDLEYGWRITVDTSFELEDMDTTDYGSRTTNVSNTSMNSVSGSEWEVTDSSLSIPSHERRSVSPIGTLIMRARSLVKKRDKPVNSEAIKRREQAFRERSWTLEECSICFDIMLKDQITVQLPCSHNFHEACIGPWLVEHETCPMCRKPVAQ